MFLYSIKFRVWCRFTLYLFLTTLPSPAFSQVSCRKNVVYGQHIHCDTIIRIYFDKEGHIYPDFWIPDSSLLAADADLHKWYQEHPDDFYRLSSDYHCSFTGFSSMNTDVLEDSIISGIRKQIIRHSDNQSVTFLVHGFRKPFKDDERSTSSTTDLCLLKNACRKFATKKTCFAEVYFDGLYDIVSIPNLVLHKDLYKLLAVADVNAVNAGKSLRKIISGLPNKHINFISHSLGCKIVCTSLFDVVDDQYPTPANEVVNICLIAPSADGNELFSHYYDRHTDYNYRNADNYNLMIVYNTKDFVCLQKDNYICLIGPGPYKYFRSPLGCNYRDNAVNLIDYFADHYPASGLRLKDLTKIGYYHHVRYYSAGNNFREIVQFLESE